MKNNFAFTTIASLILAYITLSGCLWHLGYWSTFRFNYLEFANISDIFKSTVYPFFKNFWIFFGLSFLSLGLGALLHFSYLLRKIKPKANDLATTSVLTYKRFAAFVISISAIVCFFFSGVLFGGKIVFKVFPISLGVFVGTILFYFSVLKKQVIQDEMRFILLVGLAIFPGLNFSLAKSHSLEIKAMLRYNEVTDVNTSDSILSKQILHTAFLGSTDNFHFFYTPTKVSIIRAEAIKSFTISEVVLDSNYAKFLNLTK